ncbi:MAG: TetR family transcriptional regulator [Streptosporangiales bacterium]|nr:TetR family transcriptional regulator [Streptosporangiales bacterium]
MPTIRHSTDRVLDAARECVLAVGVRRTTLTDIARRAGTSRMTLYRRYPDVSALVADLMTREFGHVLAVASRAEEPLATARARAVAHTVAAVRALHRNPLFAKVLDVDPELLLPYLTDRVGSTQQQAVAQFTSWLDEGFADGSIRRGDRTAMAYSMLLTVQSYTLSLRVALSADVDAEAMYGELGHVLDASLAPS